MQTFLPYPDFGRSAACLDTRRLGKQRVEALQILRAISGASSGWQRHPATMMWRGHEPALRNYQRACILEWVARGHRNTMDVPVEDPTAVPPAWLGDERVHRSHRANLLRKHPEHYAAFGWTEDPSMPYVWPTRGQT